MKQARAMRVASDRHRVFLLGKCFQAILVENKHAEKPAFAHLPLVRPGFAKKVSELKAFNSRSAFLNSHQQEVVIRHT